MKICAFLILLLSTMAFGKVDHQYIFEICDQEEDLCAVWSQQGDTIGLIANQEFVETLKDLAIDLNVIQVSQEFYDSIAEPLERHSIGSFYDEDDFLEAKGKGSTMRKLKKIFDAWDRAGGSGSSGGGSGSSGGSSSGSKKKKCTKCHTDGKHSRHPPT